jgi:hypothetical protein
MKSSQITFKGESTTTTSSAMTMPHGSHYKFLMGLGRVLPSTTAQARHFLSKGLGLDVLNSKDVEVVEVLLNKHGFEGDYKYTKSKNWVRLQNVIYLHEALQREYLSK